MKTIEDLKAALDRYHRRGEIRHEQDIKFAGFCAATQEAEELGLPLSIPITDEPGDPDSIRRAVARARAEHLPLVLRPGPNYLQNPPESHDSQHQDDQPKPLDTRS